MRLPQWGLPRHGQDIVRAGPRLTAAPGRPEPDGVPPSCRIAVRVVPNASRDAAAGWQGDVLRVKVRAPALDGRANEALCAFLAGELGVRSGAVALVRGAKSRLKLVEVTGLAGPAVRARLGAGL